MATDTTVGRQVSEPLAMNTKMTVTLTNELEKLQAWMVNGDGIGSHSFPLDHQGAEALLDRRTDRCTGLAALNIDGFVSAPLPQT